MTYTAEQERVFARVLGLLHEHGYDVMAGELIDVYRQLKERLELDAVNDG